MQIQTLEYYDAEYQWELKTVEFMPNLNLLVGVSGAGKTRILKAIRHLKAIANGASLNGVKWTVCFLTSEDVKYHWSGEFETKNNDLLVDDESDTEDNAIILSEILKCNENLLVERTQDQIIFDGVKTPKLSPFESVIELLKQEDKIIPIKEALNKIILADSAREFEQVWRLPVSVLKKYSTASLLELKESNLPTPIKLSILHQTLPKEFEKIKATFIRIFNNVSNIKVETAKINENIPIAFSELLREATIFGIKEKGVSDWIDNISSGMFKTLMYISELYLSPDHSIILIDEFENSLGVNCIDSVTDLILENTNNQFMITSHHPYIINNISPEFWKIVTRQGGCVTVKNAEDFHISKSRQKAFIDLINVLDNDDEEF